MQVRAVAGFVPEIKPGLYLGNFCTDIVSIAVTLWH